MSIKHVQSKIATPETRSAFLGTKIMKHILRSVYLVSIPQPRSTYIRLTYT
jgi:hypothetical protein